MSKVYIKILKDKKKNQKKQEEVHKNSNQLSEWM